MPKSADLLFPGRSHVSVLASADVLFLERWISLVHIGTEIGRCGDPGKIDPAETLRYRHRPMCYSLGDPSSWHTLVLTSADVRFLERSIQLAHSGTNITRYGFPGEIDQAQTHCYRHRPMCYSWEDQSGLHALVPTSADVLFLEMDPAGRHRYRHRPTWYSQRDRSS